MPLEKYGIQPYFSNSMQLADVIEWVLEQTGPAHLQISTFSTGEEFLRRLFRLKRSGRILTCRMFCDLRAARKTVSLYHFNKSVFDHVCLCENHSKVLILFNDNHTVAVVTSQNQTRGNRFEAGIITSRFVAHRTLRQILAFEKSLFKGESRDRAYASPTRARVRPRGISARRAAHRQLHPRHDYR